MLFQFLECPTAKEVSSQGQALLERLEPAVDPFDLEMSSSRMNDNLAQSIHTSSALYANLVPFTPSMGKQQSSQASAENTVFLSIVPGASPLETKTGQHKRRPGVSGGAPFELLPFSMTSVRPPKPPQSMTAFEKLRVSTLLVFDLNQILSSYCSFSKILLYFFYLICSFKKSCNMY